MKKVYRKKLCAMVMAVTCAVSSLPKAQAAEVSKGEVYVYALESDKNEKKQNKQEKSFQKEMKKSAKEELKELKKQEKREKKVSVNDYDSEWNMMTVHAFANHENEIENKVKIALIDSGVDYSEDIVVHLRQNFIPGEDGISVLYEDLYGHGTSVAGIIAAQDNEIGITGINPNIELYSARVLDANGKSPVGRVVEAIYWAIANEVNIINLSFGTTVDSQELRTAIQTASDAGILIVAAAGNNGVVEYPAAYEEVIAVGAVNAQGEHSEGSAVGKELELVAPGEQIASTGAFGGVCVVGGTSMAAPHVTAIASLLWQQDMSVSADFIRALLDYSANQYGDSNQYGYGLIDLSFAMEQFDSFKEIYCEKDSYRVIQNAVEQGGLPLNNSEVLSFDDVIYVEGSWKDHKIFAEATGIETGRKLTSQAVEVLKLGAAAPDIYFYHMSYYPELHGYFKRRPEQNFMYYSNYVFSYIYLTEIARSVYRGAQPNMVLPSVTADCISYCRGHVNGWCVQQSINRIREVFTDVGLADGELSPKAGSWNKILQGHDNSPFNRSLFIYGMALHTITDLFAHSTYDENGTFVEHGKDEWGNAIGADDEDTIPQRYYCAEMAARYLIAHIKHFETGKVSDFYNDDIKDLCNGKFKIALFGKYIKAVDAGFYYSNESGIDSMSIK